MNPPSPQSWRVIKQCRRNNRVYHMVSPPWKTFEGAQASAHLFVALNRNLGRAAYARVFPSIAQPAIQL